MSSYMLVQGGAIFLAFSITFRPLCHELKNFLWVLQALQINLDPKWCARLFRSPSTSGVCKVCSLPRRNFVESRYANKGMLPAGTGLLLRLEQARRWQGGYSEWVEQRVLLPSLYQRECPISQLSNSHAILPIF